METQYFTWPWKLPGSWSSYIYIFLFQTVSSDCFGCQGCMRFAICPQCSGEIMPLTVLDHKYYWPCPGRLYIPLKKAERRPSSHLIMLVAIPFGQHACKCVWHLIFAVRTKQFEPTLRALTRYCVDAGPRNELRWAKRSEF